MVSSNGGTGLFLIGSEAISISRSNIIGTSIGLLSRNSFATVDNSSFSQNDHAAIILEDSEGFSIENCTITNNEVGINLTSSSRNTKISYNEISSNSDHGIFIDQSDGQTLDATYNWFGHSTGPYHPLINPGGMGDDVSDEVDFLHWLPFPYDPSDTSKPEIEFLSPLDEEENVLVETGIVIIFSKPMDPWFTEASLDIDFDYHSIWYPWNGFSNSMIILVPETYLNYGSYYSFEFQSPPRDYLGRKVVSYTGGTYLTESLYVNILDPGDDADISGIITISGNASPLAKDILINTGDGWGSVTSFESGHDHSGNRRSGDWEYTIDTTDLSDGPMVISARSTSGNQYSETQSISVNSGLIRLHISDRLLRNWL